MRESTLPGLILLGVGILIFFVLGQYSAFGLIAFIPGVWFLFIKEHLTLEHYNEKFKKIDLKKGILMNEIKRCNFNLLWFNIGLTVLAGFIFYIFYGDLSLNGVIILAGICFVFPLGNYYKIFRRYGNYKNHPVYLSSLRFQDPEKVSDILEKELGKNYEENKVMITKHWIANRTFFDFYFIHVSELCWVHVQQTNHSVNFIPTGKSYAIRIYSTYLSGLEIKTDSEESSVAMLKKLQTLAPWAIFGYSEDLKSLWSKDPSSFAAEVAGRREEMHKRYGFVR